MSQGIELWLRAHQAGFSRRSLAGVGLSESVRCHGPGLALMTNGGVQQQQQHCPPSLLVADRQWSCHVERSAAFLELRKKTWALCIEVLPSTPHSALDSSVVAKTWKKKLQKSLYFLTYPPENMQEIELLLHPECHVSLRDIFIFQFNIILAK
ncbi:hypothetical protein TNCV_1833791 [Trichonephila clavipes]|nr:hypothetical protein TNCV_1833791 [Trichonephila clavipes]